MRLILFGIVIHLMYLYSIFDIYFKSPIIHGMPTFTSDLAPPAKRVVLFVADGLRAESLFGKDLLFRKDMKTVAPFLSTIIDEKGSFGISHTRVPTESRPGHVALFAGIYEDPSAVAKGWKVNPVEFDSVFNQSTYTWAWGSPDIVPMFSKVSGEHVFTNSYSPEEEDFSGTESTTLLDKWVFDKVEHFLKREADDEDLYDMTQTDKIIFFLHLLGLDTAGHTHKPKSPEHLENIRVVDSGVHKMVKLFERYYRDKNTAYIFTSDHGMTDWGSHGAGSAMETETPIIAWGAGIARNFLPVQIQQADIAPLISTLIGIPIPVNSIGLLPVEFLDLSTEQIAHALYANARQIYAQYIEKRERTEENAIEGLYKPFSDLAPVATRIFIKKIYINLRSGRFREAMDHCYRLMEVAKEGLDYYQNYYQRLLLTCISASYCGWITLLFLAVTETPKKNKRISMADGTKYLQYRWLDFKRYMYMHLFYLGLIFITVIVIYIQCLPGMYFVYCVMPQILWWAVTKIVWIRRAALLKCVRTKTKVFFLAVKLCIYGMGIQTLVACFFNRVVLAAPLACLSVWPLCNPKISMALKTAWFISTITLCIFPTLPVVGTKFNIYLVGFTGLVWILLSVVSLILTSFTRLRRRHNFDRHHIVLAIVQNILIAAALLNMEAVDKSFTLKNGLTPNCQLASWCLLLMSLVLPLFGTHFVPARLMCIMQSFITPLILLSVSYEPLFMLALFINLLLWLTIEQTSFHPAYHNLTTVSFLHSYNRKVFNVDRVIVNKHDFRRGYFFLLYMILAFFGTGNMASLNSFDPMWVRNFLTVFSPFSMAGLILFKFLIPYLIVSCVFRALTVCIQAPVQKMFMIVLIFCDIMGMIFLHLVKNEGSWLEIGSSISHFVIVQTMVLFLLLLYGVAILLTQYHFCNLFGKSVYPTFQKWKVI